MTVLTPPSSTGSCCCFKRRRGWTLWQRQRIRRARGKQGLTQRKRWGEWQAEWHWGGWDSWRWWGGVCDDWFTVAFDAIGCFCIISTSFLKEWEALQQSIQRRERALLETKSKITHPVYSLYFPEEKQEWWWLYIADRKEQTLVSMPNHVCTLRDTEEVSRATLIVKRSQSWFKNPPNFISKW